LTVKTDFPSNGKNKIPAVIHQTGTLDNFSQALIHLPSEALNFAASL